LLRTYLAERHPEKLPELDIALNSILGEGATICNKEMINHG
jgi:hypothetical protein